MTNAPKHNRIIHSGEAKQTARTTRQLPDSLNPANWKNPVFNDPDTGQLLPDVAIAANAHESVANAVIRVERMAAKPDPFHTRAAHLRGLEQQQHRAMKQAAQAVDTAKAAIEGHYDRLAADEAEALEPDDFATEIRTHFRALAPNKRIALVQDAIKQGDAKTVAAVFSGPAYLSGLTGEQQEQYRSQYLQANLPELHAKRQRLGKAGALLNGCMDRAITESERFIDKQALRDAELQETASRDARGFEPTEGAA